MMNCEENTENSESSDEDYVPDSRIEDAASEVESDGDAEDLLSANSEDDEKKIKNNKRSKQTKRSRKKPKIAPNKKGITGQELKTNDDVKSTTEDQKKKADDLWADFMKDTGFKSKNSSSNNKSTIQTNNTYSNNDINKSSTPSSSSSSSSSTNNKAATVKITQIFEFAGEEVKVEKEVDKNSVEARLLLTPSSKTSPKKSSGTGGSLTGIGSILSQLGKKQKISTLEKTKLDWDRFKKDENLEEELEIHNKGKDGYLDKQDFLQRADLRRFEIEKEIRNVERAKRFK